MEVAIIYDPVGSHATPTPFFDRLKSAGVKIFEFHPLNPLKAKGPYSVNDRDHRKMLVVDGTHAIVGGINMSHTYQSSLPVGGSEKEKSSDPDAQYWHDTISRSPARSWRSCFKSLYLARWAQQNPGDLGDGQYFPHVEAQGSDVVRIIGSVPEHSEPRYYVTLLAAIESADTTIRITTA